MAYNVGQVEVTVFPNAQRFNEVLGPQLTERAREVGRDMGDQMADRIRERLATIGDVNLGVDTTKAGLEVDKFLAETKAKSKAAGVNIGTEFGTDFSNAASSTGRQASPLIVGAIAGGLIAGAPLMLGAAGILFGGIAAAAVHSNVQIKTQFDTTGAIISDTFTHAAQVTIPMFTSAIRRIGDAVVTMGPQFHAAFAGLTGPIDSLTSGVIMLMRNAMPGLVAAVQSAGPVFKGLESLLASVGTGLGQFFSLISQHGDAAGTTFKALGDIIGALLPILGQLLASGAELASAILPPLAGVLHIVADVLQLIAPVLPAVAAGFLAFTAVRAVTPLLASFSQSLAFASYQGGAFGKMAGAASKDVSNLASALPAIALGAVAIGSLFAQSSRQTSDWANALLQGGRAAEIASQQMAKQENAGLALNQWWDRAKGLWNDGVAQLQGYSSASDEAAQKSLALYKAMTPLQQRQQDVTRATNNLDLAISKYGPHSAAAGAASSILASKQRALAAEQGHLAVATDVAKTAAQRHQTVLESIARAASTAGTQINLLKGDLDALSGKTVDLTTAQIQLQDAVANATTATKGLTGSVVDAHGQLNVYTDAGRAAGTALIGIRDKGNQLIATMEQQGATSGQVALADSRLRQSFILTAEKMGFSAGQAQDLANKILGIPSSRNTRITADTQPAINAIDGVLTALAQVRDKTVTITTVTSGYHVAGGSGPGGTQLAGAIGGIVHPYAAGGIEPMQGGIAQVVPPGTLRVIGDRVVDDEAYIPINRDLRSKRIWAEAGQRMGLLGSSARGGGGAGTFTGNLYLDSGEFLGKVRGVASAEAETVMGKTLDLIGQRGRS